MSHFIKHIANYIASNYKDPSCVTFVMPSQRAQKYLQDALFECYNKPFFSPKFITINKCFEELVPQRVLRKTELLFELYKVYSSQNTESEVFEEFIHWGELLLNDFDEIDRYLLDFKQLFSNLKDIKEIENWSFNHTELTENQKKFLAFWEKISNYYTAFNDHLKSKNLIYAGAVFRQVSDNIDLTLKDTGTKYIFAGFNALSPAEISVIKQLINLGKAELFVEGDDFFIKNKIHEAGLFIRQIKQLIPDTHLVTTNKMASEKKNITIIDCSEHTSQAKVGLNLLANFSKEEIEQTLLLLADETLIVPAIKNLPSNIKEANITLGLPLKYTHLKTWVNLIFSIQEHFIYFKTKAAYHKDLIGLLNNSLFEKIISKKDIELCQKWQDKIISQNRIFSSIQKTEGLSEDAQQLLNILFQPWNNDWKLALKLISQLNEFIFTRLNPTSDILERSAIYKFEEAVKEFDLLINEETPVMKLNLFKSIFTSHWNNQSVAYYGNPTTGLQLMGVLETRMLSFKNVIALGLNEGKMPPNNAIQTIIPMDLRRYYGLPTPREKEAIFAHHFYRLLPEAEQIWISYFSGESALGSEASRYIKQIELEWAKENPAINLNYANFEIPLSSNQSLKSALQTETSTQLLKNLFERGFSASAMNKFLACPLNFYYLYLLGLREEETVEENIENSTFGSFVHNVLEILYTPFVGKQILESDLTKMLKEYKAELEKVFLTHFNNDANAFSTGNNQLSYQMAAYHIERFLNFEKKNLQQNPDNKLIIHALEEKLETTISLDYKGEIIPIKLTGFIDRIDQWGEEVRIIDYKTGKCATEDITFKLIADDLKDFEELSKKLKKSKHVLQLAIYALLFYKNKGYFNNTSAIFSFVNFNDGYQSLEFKDETMDVNSLVLLTEEIIKKIAIQTLDSTEFIHSADAKYCNYCGV